jgi:hypothetical protein
VQEQRREEAAELHRDARVRASTDERHRPHSETRARRVLRSCVSRTPSCGG